MATIYDAIKGEIQTSDEYLADDPFYNAGAKLRQAQLQPETNSQAIWGPIVQALIGGVLTGIGKKRAREEEFDAYKTQLKDAYAAKIENQMGPSPYGATEGIGPVANPDIYSKNLLNSVYLNEDAPKGWTGKQGKTDLLKALVQQEAETKKQEREDEFLFQNSLKRGLDGKIVIDPTMSAAIAEREGAVIKARKDAEFAAERGSAGALPDPFNLSKIPKNLLPEAVKEVGIAANTKKQLDFADAQFDKAAEATGLMGAVPFGLTGESATLNSVEENLRQAYQNAVGREMSGIALETFEKILPKWKDTPETLELKKEGFRQLVRDGTGKATPILDAYGVSQAPQAQATNPALETAQQAGEIAVQSGAPVQEVPKIAVALAQQKAEPQGFGRRMGNMVYSLADAGTLGFGDEITAGGNALIDAFQGKPLGESYDARLAQARQFEKEIPIGTKLLGALTTGVAAPFGAVKGVADAAKTAAALGSIAGFASGEGGVENRINNAGKSALVSGLLGGALGTVAKGANAIKAKAPGFADAAEAGLFGVGRTDLVKSARNAGLAQDEMGQIVGPKLLETTKRLAKNGFLKDGVDAPTLVAKAQDKVASLGDEIAPILKTADEALKANRSKVKPDWQSTKAFIKRLSGTAREDAEAAFAAEAKALANDLDGTVTALHKAKQGLWTRAYGPDEKIKSEVLQRMGRDLKVGVERATEALLPKSAAKSVKVLNSEMGDYLAVLPKLTDKAAREAAATLPEQAINFMKTTGGVGTSILASMYSGNPLPAIGGISTLLGTTDRGRALSVPALRALSKYLPENAFSLITKVRPEPLIAEKLGSKKKSSDGKLASGVSAMTKAISPSEAQAMEPVAAKAASELPRSLVNAVIHQESRGNANAVSPKGAQGLMQIMPATAKEIAAELGVTDYDLKDKETNQRFGEYYLAKQLKRFGTPELALAAYNAGPGKVQMWIEKYGPSWDAISKGIADDIAAKKLNREYYRETLNYVPSIMKRVVSV